MVRFCLAMIVATLLYGAPAKAQLGYNEPPITVPFVSTVNSCSGVCTVQPGNFIGSYTIATLPTCNGSSTAYGSVAYVTDLGGGANNVKCIANSWQHFSLGVPATQPATSGTVNITPLSSAPIQQFTGSVLTTLTVTLQTTNLYPGYVLYVSRSGLLSGVLNLGVQGLGTLFTIPALTTTRSAYVWDGSTLVQIQ